MTVAVFGYGYWARNVVRVVNELVGSADVLLVEPVEERRAAAVAAHPGMRATSQAGDALGDPAVTAVVVCTPSSTHVEVAGAGLRAGKHVFVEKPLATSVRGARELFDTARPRGLVVYPGHIFLHAPAVLDVKAALDRDEIGEIRYGVAQRASLGPRAREDVSAVWDYLIHDVYIFQELLGGAPEAVSAHGAAYLRPGIDDLAFATLEYPGQRLINLYASWYAPEKLRSMFLVGSEGMLQFEEGRPEPLRISRRGYRPAPGVDKHGNAGLELFDDGIRAVAIPSRDEPLRAEIAAFLSAARGGQVRSLEKHVLEVTGTLEAIQRSMTNRGARTVVADVGRAT